MQASGNWWGTDDPALIAVGIHDFSDSSSTRSVQWTPFLDSSFAQGGTAPSPGPFLNGPVSSPIQAGVTHLVVGDLHVPAGETAVVEAGAHLQFLPGTRFEVDGTLDLAGTVDRRGVPGIRSAGTQQPETGRA